MSITPPHKLRKWLFMLGLITFISLLVARVAQPFIPESSHVARGAGYSYAASCLNCHGQLEGSFPDDALLECGMSNTAETHPTYVGSCIDLLAFFESVRVRRSFSLRVVNHKSNRVMEGERLARAFYCFQCHGELGQGGYPNPGAFKSYIPGYFGKDFSHLTQGGNPESIHRWIKEGIDKELFEHPITGPVAKFYTNNQKISMPGLYSLSDSQLEILTDYVITLNRFGNMDAKTIRDYSNLTQQVNY